MSKRPSTKKTPTAQFSYPHPRPMLTADAVVLAKLDSRFEVLLVKRKNPPYQGSWALPGGFVNQNEPALHAAKRELAEETHLTRVVLKPIGFFDTPQRDPRGWCVSVVHLGFIAPSKLAQASPGDDASDITFLPLLTRTKLAFDHNRILRYAARWIKAHHDTFAKTFYAF